MGKVATRGLRQAALKALTGLTFGISCASPYMKTVPEVDLTRFMGPWHVIAGRFTFLEEGAHNSVETYTYNEAEGRIDIDFRYNKGAVDGPEKSIPQKGWVVEGTNNARWEVSPLWPFKFGYLIIALDKDYTWTAVGVPSQKYLWIMAREPHMTEESIQAVVEEVKKTGYRHDIETRITHIGSQR